MKYAYIFILTFLLAMMPTDVRAKDVSDKPLITFKIPITENADRAIGIITKHQKYTFTKYLEVIGIPIVEGAHCNINSKTNIVTLHLDHHSAALVTAILGDIMMYVGGRDKTSDEILKKYVFGDGE